MNKTLIIALILMIPIAYAFSSSSANYNIDGNLGLGSASDQSANYQIKSIFLPQPTGPFHSENYSAYLGLYYLEGMGYYIDIEIYNLLLNSGWNLISIPIAPKNNTVSNVFAGEEIVIFGYNNSWFVPQIIDNKLGYWIKINETTNITLQGYKIQNISITLNNGWNLIGYLYLTEENILELYENFTVYSYNGSWLSYVPNRSDNSLEILEPGYGYWVNKK